MKEIKDFVISILNTRVSLTLLIWLALIESCDQLHKMTDTLDIIKKSIQTIEQHENERNSPDFIR